MAKIEFMANPAPKKCTWKIMDENESRNNSKSCNISTIIEGRYYVNLSWTVKYTSILLEVNNELGSFVTKIIALTQLMSLSSQL